MFSANNYLYHSELKPDRDFWELYQYKRKSSDAKFKYHFINLLAQNVISWICISPEERNNLLST